NIVQEGGPRDIYTSPSSGFVADFVGIGTFVRAEIDRGGVRALGGRVSCAPPDDLPVGSQAHLVLRPENVYVDVEPKGVENEFEGTLRVAAFLGDHLDCLVDVAGELVRARAHPAQRLVRDQKVWIRMPAEQCVLIRDDGWQPRPLARSYAEED
ncbi:MAG TPA: TOBE domain-containing protein, partial [Candidatus Limnocylindria bacterium]|nr:TOBE domain-containing protein [Candidatus Limnocylindria bacterium]